MSASSKRTARRRRARQETREANRARQVRLRAAHADFVARLEQGFAEGACAPALCEMVDMGLPRRVANAITAFCAEAEIENAQWDDMARFIVWFALGAFGMEWERGVFDAWSARPLAARDALDAAWEGS